MSFATRLIQAIFSATCIAFLIAGSPIDAYSNRSTPPKISDSTTVATPCDDNQPQKLKAGEILERTLAGGECSSYEIELVSQQFLQVIVEQSGIDVVLTIYDREQNKLSQVDRPNGSYGRETISVIAPNHGLYILEVHSLENIGARGKYDLRIASIRATSDGDAKQIAAELLVSGAEVLRARGTAESFRSAIQMFIDAADIWRALKNDYEEALGLYGAGISCTSLGDNQAAIEYLNRALPMFLKVKTVSGEAMVKTAMGWPYMYLSDLDNAFLSFSAAFELQQGENNIRGQAITLYGMGWVKALSGANIQALQRFRKSLVLRRAAMDRRGEALTLAGIGKIQARLGHYARALGNLELALSILPKTRDRYAEADILSNLGWVHCALQQNARALDFFKRALGLRQQVGDSIGKATTLYGMSVIHRRQSLLAEAELEIDEALKIIESLRAKGSNLQLRMLYFASIQDYYEFYISLLMELDRRHPSSGYAARMLNACERARARGLLDLLAEAKVDIRQGVDPSSLERERVINEKLNAIANRRQLSTENSAADKRQIRDLTNELETVRGQIRKSNPQYAALTQPLPLTADYIQTQLLDEDTLLLLYTMGEEQSFLLAVTSHEITSYQLPARRKIESLAKKFHKVTSLRNYIDSGRNAGSKGEADFRAEQLANSLSRVLVEPVKDKLKDHRLIVVTPGALQFVPFAALPVFTKQSSQLGSTTSQSRQRSTKVRSALLIENHEIVSLPSLTTLAVLREEAANRPTRTNAVVVLADPVFDVMDGRIRKEQHVAVPQPAANGVSTPGGAPRPGNGHSSEIELEFPRLTSSRWEGQKILSLVDPDKGKLVIDFAANKSFASSSELGTFQIVHFATHAIIDDQHPELSGLMLSMVDEKGKNQDGFLRLHEIFKLKLPVDLVVLSGCRTALGRDFAGEGLVGLTRGFMYAGAPRVVVSLWDVADKPTSELMISFYEEMLGWKKLSPAAALRAAQLKIRNDPRWKSPHFWAPFILQGDWR